MSHKLKAFFDKDTSTLTYIVYDEKTKDSVLIDSVLNYDPAASRLTYASIDQVLDFVEEMSLKVHYVLETHAHADHLTGASEIKKRIPSIKIGIGKNITKVQEVFGNIYNLKDLNTNGVQFDVLLEENKPLKAGTIEIKTIFTPGHTPACSSYLIDDMLFTGDALFMPDFGTARCDFPGGSAKELYHSVHEKLYKLPDDTRTFTAHDYQPNGRELQYKSTIGEHKSRNIQLKASTTEEEFIRFRNERDSTLTAPRLLLPSIQLNISAGELPKAEDNESHYLKIPLRK
ncbi:MBL fold metallo-hydrolase [Halobacteriovorax sp. JY17]|uniref:MBL fold metallo-hydrolase n=1 Tax=Halobacteriovorax sp. JY17 TaxID=2014617 RepID=UPI0025C6C92C|nr:MBL fold metallo-hydrolase [Halobacteriovorax sp. JY17]